MILQDENAPAINPCIFPRILSALFPPPAAAKIAAPNSRPPIHFLYVFILSPHINSFPNYIPCHFAFFCCDRNHSRQKGTYDADASPATAQSYVTFAVRKLNLADSMEVFAERQADSCFAYVFFVMVPAESLSSAAARSFSASS